MTRFADKRALVTGAGSGVGAAIAHLLEAERADVVAADLTVTEVHLDVRDEAQVVAVASEHLRRSRRRSPTSLPTQRVS